MSTLGMHESVRTGEEVFASMSADQYRLVRQAAGALDLRVEEFLVASTIANAERVLEDHRWMMIAQDATKRFQTLLEDRGVSASAHS